MWDLAFPHLSTPIVQSIAFLFCTFQVGTVRIGLATIIWNCLNMFPEIPDTFLNISLPHKIWWKNSKYPKYFNFFFYKYYIDAFLKWSETLFIGKTGVQVFVPFSSGVNFLRCKGCNIFEEKKTLTRKTAEQDHCWHLIEPERRFHLNLRRKNACELTKVIKA